MAFQQYSTRQTKTPAQRPGPLISLRTSARHDRKYGIKVKNRKHPAMEREL